MKTKLTNGLIAEIVFKASLKSQLTFEKEFIFQILDEDYVKLIEKMDEHIETQFQIYKKTKDYQDMMKIVNELLQPINN